MSGSRYAEGTSVDVLSSQAEVLKHLARFGIGKHAFLTDEESASVAFEWEGLSYRLTINTPSLEEFLKTPTGQDRTELQAVKFRTEEAKRRWRSLVLLVKAKTVAVEDQIATFEQEFMPYLVTSSGESLFEAMQPQIEKARTLGGKVQLALGGRS
jgi:hypothetical protein